MIRKVKLLEKYLNYLLIILFPTQLAMHFWPEFSLVYGIRVDYYSIAIYLTDVLFIVLFIFWSSHTFRDRLKDISNNKLLLFVFLAIAFSNIIFSSSHPATLFKWIKILEYLLLSYYVFKRTDVFNLVIVRKNLLISLVVIFIVGILQVLRGQTSSHLFYILGERSFSVFTPGIAVTNILGFKILRMYSIFPHPNALAGFVFVSIIFILFTKKFSPKLIEKVFIIFALLSTLLTFSLSSVIAVMTVIVFYLLFRKHLFDKKPYLLMVMFYVFLSMFLCIFSSEVLNKGLFTQQSFKERLQLAELAGNILSKNWFIGTGLNTFIKSAVNINHTNGSVWLLQPVHNIFLLIITETGIVGIGGLLMFLYLYVLKVIKFKNIWSLMIFVFILTTSLFDHYWFTIQQNMLLASLLVGLSLREK